MKLTIVVTVYNKEEYIRQCINSIIQQNNNRFSEIELIIVNDGSKDNSVEMIMDLIRKNDNITLINQENQGLSEARNNGIKIAKGEYVWCIDGDDWISPNALDQLIPLLDGKSDLLKIYPAYYTDDGVKYPDIPFNVVCFFTGNESFRNNVAQIATSVLLVYRKQFLIENNLWFMPKVFHEDNEFCPRVCYHSSRTTVVPYHLYFIRRTMNDGRESITSVVNPKRSYDMLKCMKSLATFKVNYVKERDIQHLIDEWIGQGLTTALEIVIKSGKNEISKFNSLYFEQYSFLTKSIGGGKLKNKAEAVLFYMFPHHVVQCFQFLNFFNPKKRKMNKR